MTDVYRIDKLERGARGKQTGIFVTFFNITKDEPRKYPDFCNEYFQGADVIQALESAGEGAHVEVEFTRNGKFENVSTVVQVEGGSAPAAAPAAAPVVKSSGGGNSNYRKPDEIIRGDAVRQAKDVAVGMLSATDQTKLFLKTKTTPQMVKDFIFEMADEIVAYVKGEKPGKVASDAGDLDNSGVDAGEPPTPGDDDIPF